MHLVPVIERINESVPNNASNLSAELTSQESAKLELGNTIADLSDEHEDIARGLLADPDILTLRDVGSHYDNKKLAALLQVHGNDETAQARPSLSAAASTSPPPAVLAFQRKVFRIEPSAVVARMVRDDEIPIGSTAPVHNASAITNGEPNQENPVKDGILTFFQNNPEFNLRKTSVASVLPSPEALKGIADHVKPDVVASIKLLQTTQALSHTPEALPGLVKSGMTSAHTVSQVPEAQFITSFAAQLGGESVARDIHVHATNVFIRNSLALTSLLQTVRGSGVAMIDGSESGVQRIQKASEIVGKMPEQINLESLFGTLDVCACDDCNSVTSPAAYFVEILQYLRNNNLDIRKPASGQMGYAGTPLEVLLRRRPDLADLELTCANTNTVLPYIDLANEVMESFIVNMKMYAASSPKQATLDVFNADPNKEGLGGSGPELLAQPQNTNDKAYCILKEAVYPSTKLPFHQPVEAIRLYLDFLHTNRADIGLTFRKPYTPPSTVVPDPLSSHSGQATEPSSCSSSESCSNTSSSESSDSDSADCEESSTPSPISPECRAKLGKLHDLALSRADDAERLLLTEEEYIIITKEAFWKKEYFDIRHGTITAPDVYRQRIGVKPEYEYWGIDYTSLADMLDQNETKGTGLTFVKKQFMPRSGLDYADIVDLLKTDFINPNMPKGRDQVILKSFRSTFKFLATLVDPVPPGRCHCHKEDRFKRLVDFLLNKTWRGLIAKLKLPDTASLFEHDDECRARHCHDSSASQCCTPPPRCRHHHPDPCQCHLRHRISKWLCRNFDKIGKIIVLESLFRIADDVGFLGFEADLVQTDGGSSLGHLSKDGKIFKSAQSSEQIGTVALDGKVTALGDTPASDVAWASKHGITAIMVNQQRIGIINADSFMVLDQPRVGEKESPIVIWNERMGRLVDDCDIGKDRLRHLDGTSLCSEEYDRMHRFVRLWRKLGWSMIELDVALHVLARPAAATPTQVPPDQPAPSNPSAPTTGDNDDVDWGDFVDDCQDGDCGKKTCTRCKGPHPDKTSPKRSRSHSQRSSRSHRRHHRRRSCSTSTSTCRIGCNCHGCKPKKSTLDITPEFLHEIVSLNKLIELTGFPVLNLLAFWGPISSAGSPSLYSQLFLTHNLLGIDQVFKADANDNYLAASPAAKMSDHVHILLAAFGLKIPDYVALTKGIWPDGGQDLSIETVSLLYRHVLLSRVLGTKPDTLGSVFKAFAIEPFSSAPSALELVELWNKMSDAGFTFQQLRYVLTGTEDPYQPAVGPSQRTVLQAAMTLYTGLNDIDKQHSDITSGNAATSTAVLSNVQLLFNPDVSAQIVGFLDGTLIFQTTAPPGLTINVPKEETTLVTKLKYADGENPTLQVTGQLTPDEAAKAKLLSASPQWAASIDRLARRAATFLKETLSVVFPPKDEAVVNATLIAGDVIPPPSDANAESLATAPKKRAFFLTYFMPFLRRRMADKLVIDTVAAATSLDPLIALDLLTYVIKAKDSSSGGSSEMPALQVLEGIKADTAPTDGFVGYLIPETTDAYTLVTHSESAPPDIMLDSNTIALSEHSPDDEPSDSWASKPLRLTGGRLYAIELKKGLLPKDLQWKTDRTGITPIPSSALLGNHVTNVIQDLFSLLFKCAIIINGFSLTSDEVMYFQEHAADFGDPKAPSGSDASRFDWNRPSLPEWKRLADYTSLRSSLPKLGRPLTDLFKWMNSPEAGAADATALAKELFSFTLWSESDVSRLIDLQHFDLASASHFRNEISFLKVKKGLDSANKIGVDIDLLFLWAQPRIDFWKMRDIRDSVRVAIRAQFKLSDWEVAIKPTHDKLRQLQSDALTAYLINQPALKEQRVVDMVDADSLFEFLLIDNQMCPCMETARLKQATSSVQLFVQRCTLGLEPDVPVDLLDRGRWDWMQKYRVWEANRKVYLYPENWIQPSLRDDKSPIYRQLESELNQRDLDTISVLDTMKEFLFKLDDIANLEVNAICVDSDVDSSDPRKVHIFARTRAAPYKFFYRAYDWLTKTWQPWQDMAIDIPRYEVEKPKKSSGPAGGPETPGPSMAKPGGFYLVPFTFNSRLLVAIPQFQKVQLPAPVPQRKMADLGNNADADESTPDEFWEIKMGLAELRNGRWTPKQVTSQSIAETPQGMPPSYPTPIPPLGAYKFIARKNDSAREVHIDAYRLVFPPTTTDPSADTTDVKAVGRFTFTGSRFGVDINGPLDVSGVTMKWSDFHFQGTKTGDPAPNPADYRVMYPIQGTQSGGFVHEADAYVKYPFDDTNATSSIRYGGKPADEAFYHPFVEDLIDAVSRTDNLDDLFSYFASGTMGDSKKSDAYGTPQNPSSSTAPFDELYRPYSLYNWEMAFHAPMAIVDRLLQNQQFDLALKMIHYVFDPLAKGTDAKRYWKWQPFHDINSVSSIEHLFDALRPNTAEPLDGPINAWRNTPFQPHLVARQRPTAYMKYVVMKYISILIAYGDFYFQQNTLETIPMAIQCYVLASHIYGKPAQKIPKRGDKVVQTYKTLLDKWDPFSNAMVQMEVLFPFSINQIPAAVGVTNGVVGLANIFGFAATQYFCLPENANMKAVRDTIDDRLYKIRHCQDIKGVVRSLPLYEPPIDPGLLVAAAAAGLSLSSVLNDLNAPLPNFRFKKLVKKAIEICEHLKDLGTSLVVAKERKDGEALMALKQRHESTVHALVMNQKKLTLDEANKAVDALQQTRKAPEYRMKHNMQLLGEDLGSIPTVGDAESEFREIADKIEAPVAESGLKLIAAEKDELDKVAEALNLKPIINAIETAASELHVLPTLNAHASPFGVGVASCWGPPNIAKGIQGVAKAYQTVSDFIASQSAKISRVQNLARTTQARVKEANSTGHEIKKIDKQIVTHQVRVAVQEADVAAHEHAISNTQEVQDFLTSKYTSTELYTWVDQETSNLYYRTYTAAYDLAKKAELAFRYERGLPETSNPPPFVQFGYWEPKNSGLLCGERLMVALRDLEAAYYETRGHDYEITKHVSLRAINPLQLLRLRGDAVAEFAVPEILFDMDFPGHYGRRLKSVALTIRSSAALSAYDNVNCTLRLTSHTFRNTSIISGKSDYPEKTDSDDPHFSSASHVPIDAIATSSPTLDSGVFHLDFCDDVDRFLPFEGAGAISKWRLELNDVFRGFDYNAIDDVVVSLRYTSLEGGARLRDAANMTVSDYVKSVADLSETEGLYAVFDVPRDFPAEWAAVTGSSTTESGGAQPATRKMNLTGLNTRLPAYAKNHAPERIQTRDVWVVTDKALVPGDMSIRQGGQTLGLTRVDDKVGRGEGAMSAMHSTDGPVALKDWVVSVGEAVTEVKEMWILARYSLKP